MWVLKHKTSTTQTFLVLQGDAAEVDGALFVQKDLKPLIVENGVALAMGGELEQIGEP